MSIPNAPVDINLDVLTSRRFWMHSRKGENLQKFVSFWGLIWRSLVFVLLPTILITVGLVAVLVPNTEDNFHLLVLFGTPIGILLEVLLVGVALKHYGRSRYGQYVSVDGNLLQAAKIVTLAKIFWGFAWRLWLIKFVAFWFINALVIWFDVITHTQYIEKLMESESWLKLGWRFDSGLLLLLMFFFLTIFKHIKISGHTLEIQGER